MSKYKKITQGFVVQEFDENGKALEQEFVAGDQVEYEIEGDDNVYSSLIADLDYLPFEMKSPSDMS